MEDAIRTTTLSKEWRNVCISLPHLEFDEFAFIRKGKLEDFKDIVAQTFLLHDDSDINSFRLTISKAPISILHLNSWISFVVRHNAQRVTLHSVSKEVEKLPHCLFTCTTLKMLELSNIHLKLPSTVRLPLLKSLILCGVKFAEENPTPTNNLLSDSCCPLLEHLEMISCYQTLPNKHVISAPNLKHLELVKNCLSLILTNPSMKNVRKFIYSASVPILIYKEFQYMSDVEFEINTSPTTLDDHKRNLLHKAASKNLMGLRNVVKLTLKGFFIEFLTMDPDLSTCLDTSCHSLRALQIDIHSTENQVQASISLLRSYPNLQTLRISLSQGDSSSANMLNMKECWLSDGLPTKDILKQLKAVEIDSFQGNENELALVRYLIVSASTLEKMNIKLSVDCRKNLENRIRISEMLLTYARASTNAAIFVT